MLHWKWAIKSPSSKFQVNLFIQSKTTQWSLAWQVVKLWIDGFFWVKKSGQGYHSCLWCPCKSLRRRISTLCYDHHGTIWVKFFSLVVICNTIWGNKKLDDTLWCCTKNAPPNHVFGFPTFFALPPVGGNRWASPTHGSTVPPSHSCGRGKSTSKPWGNLEGRVVMFQPSVW